MTNALRSEGVDYIDKMTDFTFWAGCRSLFFVPGFALSRDRAGRQA